MFRFLSAIGLSNYVEAGRLRELIGLVLRNPDQIKTAYLRAGAEKMNVEKRVNMGPFFVTITELAAKSPEFTEIYPGVRELWGPVLEDLIISEDPAGHMYATGVESRTGELFTLMLTSMAGIVDKGGKIAPDRGMKFSCYGLSVDGRIILGSEIDEEGAKDMKDEAQWREDVLRRAMEGDESAFSEINSYMDEVDSEIRERLKGEDLYSVLDGFFSPMGPDGRYNVLGEILHVDKMMNPMSEKWVYRLEVKTMTASMGIYINPRDLVGVPEKGRRFRGTVRVVGMADPERLLDDLDRGFF